MGPGDPWLRLGWRCSALPWDMGTSQPRWAARQPPRSRIGAGGSSAGRWSDVTGVSQPLYSPGTTGGEAGKVMCPRGDPRRLLPHWMSAAGSSELSSVLVKGAAPPTPGSAAPHRSESGEGRSTRVKPKLATNPQGRGEPCSPEGLLLSRGAPARSPGARTLHLEAAKAQTPSSSSRAAWGGPEPHLPPPGWGSAETLLGLQTAGLGEQAPEGRETRSGGSCCWPLPLLPGL